MNYSIILPTLNENGHIIKLINEIIKNFRNKKRKYENIKKHISFEKYSFSL